MSANAQPSSLPPALPWGQQQQQPSHEFSALPLAQIGLALGHRIEVRCCLSDQCMHAPTVHVEGRGSDVLGDADARACAAAAAGGEDTKTQRNTQHRQVKWELNDDDGDGDGDEQAGGAAKEEEPNKAGEPRVRVG